MLEGVLWNWQLLSRIHLSLSSKSICTRGRSWTFTWRLKIEGVLQTCINATTMALITGGIPLVDFVCGLTVGMHTSEVVVDLTNVEETDVPHLTIATMPRSGKATLVSMETRMNVERFGEMLGVGGEAGQVIGEEMREAVRAWGEARVKTQTQRLSAAG